MIVICLYTFSPFSLKKSIMFSYDILDFIMQDLHSSFEYFQFAGNAYIKNSQMRN